MPESSHYRASIGLTCRNRPTNRLPVMQRELGNAAYQPSRHTLIQPHTLIQLAIGVQRASATSATTMMMMMMNRQNLSTTLMLRCKWQITVWARSSTFIDPHLVAAAAASFDL